MQLTDMGRYYKTSFFLQPDEDVSFEKQDKPIVFEIVLREGKEPDSLTETVNAWESAGFKLNGVFRRMRLNIGEGFIKSLEKPADMGYNVITANETHLTAVMEIWEKAFDPIINLLPDEDETRKLIKNGEVIIAVTDEGIVIGVLQMGFTKSAGTITHEAVSPDYRNKKVGHALTSRFFEILAQKGIYRSLLWVVDGNDGARRFHSRYGFKPDGTYIKQYLLR